MRESCCALSARDMLCSIPVAHSWSAGSAFSLNDLVKTLNESHKDARASWSHLIQIILVNVLLPVLTALLGYIFGSSRRTG
jgi:hypothetical protein